MEGKKGIGYKSFIDRIRPHVVKFLVNYDKPIKTQFIYVCNFKKDTLDLDKWGANASTQVYKTAYFPSKIDIIYDATNISDTFKIMTDHQLELIEQFQESGSGWVFNYVEYFDIHIDKYEPIAGSSYIPTPNCIANKHAVINVKNENDNHVFQVGCN